MPVNLDKPQQWKPDIIKSVDMYNDWFMKFAPAAYRERRIITTKTVENALDWTRGLRDLTVEMIEKHPEILPMLRMSTCPPLARDRLIGLADLSKSFVLCMESRHRLPPKMPRDAALREIEKIRDKILMLVDPDIFVWLPKKKAPVKDDLHRAATIVADRLCGSETDPIIRNEQEKRQLKMIGNWLTGRKYKLAPVGTGQTISTFAAGTYSVRLNTPIRQLGGGRQVNIPIDVVVKPHKSPASELPLLIECKSAGDFTNPNKRRKEEATKISQLRATYGANVRFILFLCGYFDTGYLGYEAGEGIDWVWEHRIDDLALFGL